MIDTSVPNWARVWGYLLGGKDTYDEDRKAGDQLMVTYPGIAKAVRHARHFQSRAVHRLAGEAGVRQFLDIGPGLPRLPFGEETHDIAQQHVPECRVAYVDNDPLVLVCSRALRTSRPEGHVAHIDADARDVETIWAEAIHAGFDPEQPVAVLFINILECLDRNDAHTMLEHLRTRLPAGSYLAIAHLAKSPYGSFVQSMVNQAHDAGLLQLRPRSVQQITAFFDGWEVLEPGIVQAPRWRPEAAVFGPVDVPMYAGLGRKPRSST
ncbi:SAM-dependent methyltransferase [Actinomadura violacea]|uniref:SAM-dependent methyltransferase n=1 Tax=Actinomadura violacea TaxID=2819934 RepID=A0ABS3S6W4_9ACTN|nr:SAM-dependent methyltransferase [Actinomadura violacea]MBO2464004.1 SAM-dependent methyltransferase [Actinomadura violacea]